MPLYKRSHLMVSFSQELYVCLKHHPLPFKCFAIQLRLLFIRKRSINFSASHSTSIQIAVWLKQKSIHSIEVQRTGGKNCTRNAITLKRGSTLSTGIAGKKSYEVRKAKVLLRSKSFYLYVIFSLSMRSLALKVSSNSIRGRKCYCVSCNVLFLGFQLLHRKHLKLP